jgi:hypothetical protein
MDVRRIPRLVGRSFGKDIQWFKFVMEWSMKTPRTMDKKKRFLDETFMSLKESGLADIILFI